MLHSRRAPSLHASPALLSPLAARRKQSPPMAAPWMLLGRVLRVGLGGPPDAEADPAAAADFLVPVAAPPHITLVTANRSAHPYPGHPDTYPFLLVANRVGLLVRFHRDELSRFVLVRGSEFHHHLGAEAQEGEITMLTATAEHLPLRRRTESILNNNFGISLAFNISTTSISLAVDDSGHISIAELVVTRGREYAKIIYCIAGGSRLWFEEEVDSPLVHHDRLWVPSGVVFHDCRHFWFDLSWGLLSCSADLFEDEITVLLFHNLPEGRTLGASRPDIHERRCIGVSGNRMRYVEIIVEGESAPTVSMWSAFPVHHNNGNNYSIEWELVYQMSFDEIWNDGSYTATRMPRRVPVLTAVSPTNPDLVFFSLVHERRLFGVNVPQHRVVAFVDEPYDLRMPAPLPSPSSRHVLAWLMPENADDTESGMASTTDSEDSTTEEANN